MADVESNINVNIDTSNALASIRRLQSEISAFHTSMAKGGAAAAATSAQLQQGLINSVNATGNFSASMQRVKSTTEAFTTSLEKNKFSLGEYFRYAGASTKTFGRMFQTEMGTIDKVARERVKDLQTQYIKLGRDATGAMKSIAIRPLTLDLQDLGTKTAIAAQKQQLFNQLIKQGTTNLLNFGKNTQWAGRQLMVGFTIPLGIAGAAAAREFMKLEEQAIRFKRVYGDTFTPAGETDKMIAQIKGLANAYTTYGIAVEKTMSLAADAAAMGKTGADLLAQVDQASKLAVLGGVDQQKALETTISLTSAFGTATRDLAKDINFLNAVENQTITSIDDLTTAIPTAAPVIQQLGGDVQDLTFFLTAMREGGINASEGANALKSGLASMINPTTAATEMLNKFGINLQGIMDKDKGNVKQMVIDLGAALNSLDPTNRAQAIEQMFGKFQFARMSTLFQNVTKEGSQASRVLQLTARSASELALLSERELKKVSDSPMYKFQAALEKFQAALAPVGEAFLKLVTPILEWAKTIIDSFNNLGDGAKNFIMILVGAVAGLGPILLMGFGLIANGAANLMKGLMGLFNFFKKMGGQSKILGEQTKYMSQEQLNAMAAAASLEQAHNSLTQAFTSEKTAIRQLITAYEQASVAQGRFMSTPTGTGKTRKPVKKATGGVISGPGTGTSDSIPAMLSNGEAIIPAKEVAANRGLVEGLIAGNIPGFSKGGIMGYAGGGIVGNPLLEIFKRFKKSKKSKMPVTDFGELLSPSKGHSFPDFQSNPYGNKAMGGLYRKPDGSLAFVKPQMDERGAVAELRATQIAREAHGLNAPKQTLRVMMDPNDEKQKRKVFALESPFDETLASPTGTFTKEELGKQLVASLLRGDKDLSQSNMYSNVLADVGTAGVFDRASGFRDFAPQMPTMEDQAMVNLLAVRGGAKRAFAETTADIARSMTPQQYNNMIISEIDTVLPKLEKTIASFGLTDPQEIAAYQGMVERLRQGRGVDWSRFQGIHSAVQSKPQKLAIGTPKVARKPVARGYDFDDTLINLSNFLPGHREANAKLPKEQRKSWGWEAIKGAAPMPKVIQNLLDSQAAGKKIIIMTARPNTMDRMTTAHLKALGINPKNVKLISRDVADKSLSGLSTAELKAVQAKNVMDEYDLEAFFDDMQDNRDAVAGLGVNVFDPLKFASGSHMVPGRGNKDTVAALLTPGEAVIPKEQAEKYRPLIRGMIAGNLPGYQDGTDDVSDSGEDLIRARTSGSGQAAVDKILQYRLRAVAKGVEKEFMDALAPILEAANGKIGADKFKRELKGSNPELYGTINTRGRSDIVARAHVGEGIKASPTEAVAMTENSTRSIKDVADLAKFLEDMGEGSKEVAIKHGLFFDTLQSLNKELDMNGADIAQLTDDLEARGSTAWKRSIELGGEAFENVAEETEKFHKDLLARLRDARSRGVERIVDTEEQAVKLRAAGQKVESVESNVSALRASLPQESKLRLALDKAENTAYELRLSLSKKEQERLLAKYAAGTKEGDELRRLLKATQFQTTSGARSTTTKVSGTPIGAIDPSKDYSTPESVKAAKAAGAKIARKATKDVTEAVETSVEKRAENASPSKRGGRAGDDIVDGIMQPVEEASKRAKAAGTKIADRVVNTNPAFGRVPQVAPVVTPGMQQYVGEQINKIMPGGAFNATQIRKMGIPKLSGDFSILRTNIKNMSTQLTLAKTPATMLRDAIASTRGGLITAGESVRDFGIKAAASAKAFGDAAVRAAVQFGQGAKQMIVNAPGGLNNFYNGNGPEEIIDENGNKTKKYGGMRGKIIEGGNKFGGKVAGAGMGIGMAAMMASSMGGPVGEIANQLSGPIMAISSIASIFQMFPGILAAMTGPIGLVVAGLAAAGIGLYMMYDHLIKTRDAAKQAAEATAISTTNTQKMAEATGTLNPSQVMQKQRKSMFTGQQQETPTWGQAQLETDFGKDLKTQLETSIKGVGAGETAKKFGNQLATNVVTGVMTQAEAIDLASALGTSLNNKSLGIDIIGNISKLLGPNGKDITKDPIDIAMNLTNDTSKDLGSSLSKIQNTGMAMWGSKEWDAMVGAEQEAAVQFSSLVTQSQMLVDNLDLEHQRRVENLTVAGDMAGLADENSKYEANRQKLITDNTTKLNAQLEAYKKLPQANQNAIAQASREGVKTQFKGTEQEAAANATADALGATKTTTGSKGGSVTKQILSSEQQILLSTNIQAGNIDVATFQKLTDFMKPAEGGNGAMYTAIANVSATLGGPAAGQLTDILSNFGPGQEAAAIVISAKIENADPKSAQDMLDTYSLLQKNAGQAGTDLIAASGEKDKSGKATAAAKKAQTQIDKATKAYNKIDELAARGPITMEVVAQTEGFEDAKFEAGWFDGLPKEAKKFALQYFVSVSASVTDKDLQAWMASNGTSSKYYKGRGTYDYGAARNDYATQLTQSMTNSLNDSGAFGNTGGGGYDNNNNSGGGGAEEAPRTIADVIADQKKRITEINNQTTAVRKLVAAGLSLADAYAIASNAEDAALIAHGATAAQLADLAAKTREAEKATKAFAAAQSLASSVQQNLDKKDLAIKLASDNTLSNIQKQAILDNEDLATLYMSPKIDPTTLQKALNDATNATTYQLNINKLTISGLQNIWQDGMSKASEAFSAQENVIKINFKAKSDPFKNIIEAGQRAIADIQNKPGGLDDLDADLQRIANKEFEINKAYDEKIKALDAVSKINDRIISQQKSQLGLASALSSGDIAAAARAAQDIRSQDATASLTDQKDLLEQSRKSEIGGITGESGLTRDQIEEKVRDLKAQVLEIEEKRLEPAQRQMDLLDRMQQDQINALTVLGKTKDEWDAINSSLELANTKTKEFQDAMREALNIASTLGTALATGVVPSIGSNAPSGATTPARAAYSYPGQVSSGSTGSVVKKLQSALNAGGAGLEVDGKFGPKTRQAVVNFQRNQGLTADGIAGPNTWQKLYDVKYFKKGGKVSYMSKGGIMSYMKNGGMMPYMAMGGIADMLAKGTDTIPAMLTAGEFVMSKPAVDKIGAGRLAELNRGYDKNTNNSSDSVYNYNISVNANTNANPTEIAQTVVKQIRGIDYQRVKGNRF